MPAALPISTRNAAGQTPSRGVVRPVGRGLEISQAAFGVYGVQTLAQRGYRRLDRYAAFGSRSGLCLFFSSISLELQVQRLDEGDPGHRIVIDKPGGIGDRHVRDFSFRLRQAILVGLAVDRNGYRLV